MKNIMDEARDIVDRLYKKDHEKPSNEWHDFYVQLILKPNPLDYDGVDQCIVEIHETKKEHLSYAPWTKLIFDQIIERYDGFSAVECFGALNKDK